MINKWERRLTCPSRMEHILALSNVLGISLNDLVAPDDTVAGLKQSLARLSALLAADHALPDPPGTDVEYGSRGDFPARGKISGEARKPLV